MRDARLRGGVSGSPRASLLNELEVKTETRRLRFHPHTGDFLNDCFRLLRFHTAIIPDAHEKGSSPEKTNKQKKGFSIKMISLRGDDPLTPSDSAGVEIFGKTLVTFSAAQSFIFISA